MTNKSLILRVNLMKCTSKIAKMYSTKTNYETLVDNAY